MPRTLTLEQIKQIIDAQQRVRDRFLFALLFGTGMRIGQALGLRHGDLVGHERRIELVPREDNVNGARGKGARGSIPITSELVRGYADYMHEEYGELDCDYVFVNLLGRADRAADALRQRRRDRAAHRRRVGFDFTAHQFRHTYATLARRGGVPIEVVSRLLTHGSLDTTAGIYVHSSVEDLRSELERAGWLPELGTTGA